MSSLSHVTGLRTPFESSVPKSFPSQTLGLSFKEKNILPLQKLNEERKETFAAKYAHKERPETATSGGIGKEKNLLLCFLSPDKYRWEVFLD